MAEVISRECMHKNPCNVFAITNAILGKSLEYEKAFFLDLFCNAMAE